MRPPRKQKTNTYNMQLMDLHGTAAVQHTRCTKGKNNSMHEQQRQYMLYRATVCQCPKHMHLNLVAAQQHKPTSLCQEARTDSAAPRAASRVTTARAKARLPMHAKPPQTI
jgi:hypothetical protein